MSAASTGGPRPPSVDDFEALAWKARIRQRLRGGADEVPLSITRYVLREQIGRGGMGLVYAAHDPDLERPVAIKLLRRGDDPLATNLREEARILAGLDHSNIVPIYDIGVADGRVFLVMPLLDGVTLDVWTRRAHSDARRVDVLLRVARGLAAAHREGVLHRDVKPANIMVTADDVPMILDFGLGRRMRTPSTLGDSHRGARLTSRANGGTLGYLPPEQAENLAIDVRADVYAFCVTAIECLSHRAPAPQWGPVCSPDELEEMLSMVDVRWREALRVGVRHDPARRHASMEAIITALERSAPPSKRLRWWGVATVGVSVALWNGLVPPRAELPEPMLRAPSDASLDARHAFDAGTAQELRGDYGAAAEHFESSFALALEAGDDDTEIASAVAMARTLARLRRPAEADRWIRHAESARPRASDPVMQVRIWLASSQIARARGKLEEAQAFADRAVSALSADTSENVGFEVRANLGQTLLVRGDSQSAVEALTATLDVGRRAGLPDTVLGSVASDLAAAHLRHGDAAAAGPILKDAIATMRGATPVPELALARASQNLAIVRWREGNLAGAIESFRFGVQQFESVLGPDHPEVAHALENLGTGLIYAREHSEAVEVLNRALVIRESTSGGEHPDIARTLGYLAQAHEGAQQWDDADTFARRAYTMAVSSLGERHSTTAEAAAARSRISAMREDFDTARAFAEKAIAIYDMIGAGPLERGSAHASLAFALCRPSDFCARAPEDHALAVEAVGTAQRLFIEAGEIGKGQLEALDAWAANLEPRPTEPQQP